MSYNITQQINTRYSVENTNSATLLVSFISTQTESISQVSVILKQLDGVCFIDWGNEKITGVKTDGHDYTATSEYTEAGEYAISIYGTAASFTKLKIQNNSTLSGINLSEIGEINGLAHLELSSITGVVGSIDDAIAEHLGFLSLDSIDSITGGDLSNTDNLMYLYVYNCDSLDVNIGTFGGVCQFIDVDGNNSGTSFIGDASLIPTTVINLEIYNGIGNSTSGEFPVMPYANRVELESLNGAVLDVGSFTKSTIAYISINGFGVNCSGTVADLSAVSQYLQILNCTGISGNIEDAASSLSTLYLVGNNITYGGGSVPGWPSTTIYFQNALLTATIDSFLIAAATTAESGVKTWNLKGDNQARSAASDAAVLTLNGLGKTIQTN